MYTIDEAEVSEARWFALSDLEALCAAHDRPSPAAVRFIEQPELPEGRRGARVPLLGCTRMHRAEASQSAPFSAQARMRSGLSLGLAWELLVVTVSEAQHEQQQQKWERWWWRRRKTSSAVEAVKLVRTAVWPCAPYDMYEWSPRWVLSQLSR